MERVLKKNPPTAGTQVERPLRGESSATRRPRTRPPPPGYQRVVSHGRTLLSIQTHQRSGPVLERGPWSDVFRATSAIHSPQPRPPLRGYWRVVSHGASFGKKKKNPPTAGTQGERPLQGESSATRCPRSRPPPPGYQRVVSHGRT